MSVYLLIVPRGCLAVNPSGGCNFLMQCWSHLCEGGSYFPSEQCQWPSVVIMPQRNTCLPTAILYQQYFFNALNFFKITVCPGEIPSYNKVSCLDGNQDFGCSEFSSFHVHCSSSSDSGGGAVNVEICRQHCVQHQDVVQALGICISLFGKGCLYFFFAFCRDRVSHSLEVIASTQASTLLGCYHVLVGKQLNSQHTAQK